MNSKSRMDTGKIHRNFDGVVYTWMVTEYTQNNAIQFLKNQYPNGRGGISVKYRIVYMPKTKTRPGRYDVFVLVR